MSKHTPAPWKSVAGANNHPLVMADTEQGRLCIAEVSSWRKSPSNVLKRQAVANLALICAAPELLAACQSLLAMVRRAEREGHKVSMREGDEFMAAERAVAKATGGGDS